MGARPHGPDVVPERRDYRKPMVLSGIAALFLLVLARGGGAAGLGALVIAWLFVAVIL